MKKKSIIYNDVKVEEELYQMEGNILYYYIKGVFYILKSIC